MDFKKVADHFRNSVEPLAASNIVIITNQGDFAGNGKLRKNKERIELEVTLAGDQELPTVGGTITREQFWKIGGIIEGQVPFWGVSIPNQHSVHAARFTVKGGRFSFDRIHHLSIPFDVDNLRDAVLESARTPQPEDNSGRLVRGYMQARLTDFKIIWCDGMSETVETNPFLGDATRTERNTLQGVCGDFEYGLIQRESDCEINLRLKKGAEAPIGGMKRVSQALYRALAFVHGRSCWPQWESVDDGAGNEQEYTTASRVVSDNIYTPLTERTCADGSSATQLISKTIECFLRNDDLTKALENFLFLTREASAKDTPIHVKTLGLCAVFEGFTGFLFDHLCARDVASDASQFELARSCLVKYAEDRVAAGDSQESVGAWKRFIGMLQSARSLRPADKYSLLIQHLQLGEDKMSSALDAWKQFRHPLAHGAAQKDDMMEQMFAASRIAGAINVMAAAVIGYSGIMVLSLLDDKFIELRALGPGAETP